MILLYAHNVYALGVNNVRFGAHPDKMRVVLEISDVTDFRVFTLADPYRMVIDLPSFDWNVSHVTYPKAALVSDLRQGSLQRGVSRIVFDLAQPATIQSAFLLPRQGGKPDRIVIDYKPASKSDFMAQKGIIHGTLKLDDASSQKELSPPALDVSRFNGAPVPPRNDQRPDKNTVTQKPLIVIDAGHGGQDPGALGPGKMQEKHVALALAKELKRQLIASGRYRVVLTREKDVFIRLRNRVKIARAHNGDLFISLHADSIHKPHIRGASVYTISKKASDKQTAKLAAKENSSDLIAGAEFDVEDEQVAFILGDFLMNDTMNQSKFVANKMVSSFRKNGIRVLENPHRYAGFAVLKAPDIPSILIEAGFMSNKHDARLLNQAEYRRKIARAIHQGVDSYFAHVANNDAH